MSIKMSDFNTDLVRNYFENMTSAESIWLFGSHTNNQTSVSINSQISKMEFLRKGVFGTKLLPSDFSYSIPKRSWEQGRVYAQWDDQKDISSENYFIVIDPDGDNESYHIYKCLSNNYNSISTSKPTFNGDVSDGMYYLNDGYIWKHMQAVSPERFSKFFAKNYIPIQDIPSESVLSGIYNIIVENRDTNRGYVEISATINQTDLNNTRLFIRTSDFFDVTENIYAAQCVYIRKYVLGNEIGARKFMITGSGTISGKIFVDILYDDSSFSLSQGDSVSILPNIRIEGDGYGAVAVPIFTESRITSVRILNAGSNYSRIIASVDDPVNFNEDNPNRFDRKCILRPIVSSLGGHGSNILTELNCKNLTISKDVSSLGSSLIPNSNTYSKVGIVKNPEFINPSYSENTFSHLLKMVLNRPISGINVGNIVTQNAVRGVVHSIDFDENSIFVCDYYGPYSETFYVSQPIKINDYFEQINSINEVQYQNNTGQLLAISDSIVITRSENRIERFKTIIDF